MPRQIAEGWVAEEREALTGGKQKRRLGRGGGGRAGAQRHTSGGLQRGQSVRGDEPVRKPQIPQQARRGLVAPARGTRPRSAIRLGHSAAARRRDQGRPCRAALGTDAARRQGRGQERDQETSRKIARRRRCDRCASPKAPRRRCGSCRRRTASGRPEPAEVDYADFKRRFWG
jgi:hypothetical protein